MCCCIWKLFCADKDDNKIDQAPDIKVVTTETTEKLKIDNPWMKQEEISFCLRRPLSDSYKNGATCSLDRAFVSIIYMGAVVVVIVW
jgi:hypothetical protein